MKQNASFMHAMLFKARLTPVNALVNAPVNAPVGMDRIFNRTGIRPLDIWPNIRLNTGDLDKSLSLIDEGKFLFDIKLQYKMNDIYLNFNTRNQLSLLVL